MRLVIEFLISKKFEFPKGSFEYWWNEKFKLHSIKSFLVFFIFLSKKNEFI